MRRIGRSVASLAALEPLPWGVLFATGLLVFFAAWGQRELNGTSAFYAALSRQIAETGVWSPILHGEHPYVLKPPLQFWLTALTFKLFGPTVTAATLWPRLFGLGCILLTADLGRRLFSPAAGFFAALTLVANVTLIENSNKFRLDAPLLFGILLSMRAGLVVGGRWRPPAFYGGVVLALLSKGLPGLLPLVVVPLHAWWSGRWKPPWRPAARPWLVWALLLTLPVLWYADQYQRFGDSLFQQLLGDATRAENRTLLGYLESALYQYILAPPLRWLPFSPFMLWGLARAVREARSSGAEGAQRGLARTLLFWVVLVMLVLFAKKTHRVRYLLLILPPLALLGGREIAQLLGDQVPRRVSQVVIAGLGVAALVLASGLPRPDEHEGLAAVGVMDRVLDAELGPSSVPAPLLLPNGAVFRFKAGQNAPADWAYFHLGRWVEPLHPGDLPQAATARGSHYLVDMHHFDELIGTLPLRVITRSRSMALVAWLPDGP